LYKDRFDGYVTNTGDIIIRIVLNIGTFLGRPINRITNKYNTISIR